MVIRERRAAVASFLPNWVLKACRKVTSGIRPTGLENKNLRHLHWYNADVISTIKYIKPKGRMYVCLSAVDLSVWGRMYVNLTRTNTHSAL